MRDVGQVLIFGQQKYAPTIRVNPAALAARGIGLDDVANAVSGQTADLPVGTLQGPQQSYQIGTNGQLFSTGDIGQAVVVYRNGARCGSRISARWSPRRKVRCRGAGSAPRPAR